MWRSMAETGGNDKSTAKGRNKTHLPRRGRLAGRVNQVRIGVVDGKDVIKARFDDPITRWDGAGRDANALVPQAEVA